MQAPWRPSEFLERCARDADMVMLRALYLSWRKAVRETPMQRFAMLMSGLTRPAR